jgi:AAA15 family ATPase/GTPase
MLVEFRIANYRSFKGNHVLSLVATKDNILNDNWVVKDKLQLLKSAGIYGPNASGKSNLIKAIDTMRDLVLFSARSKPGKRLPVKPFLLDDKSKIEPSFFEVTFYHEGIRYQYGFTANMKRIEEEWLLAYPKGRAQSWFERKFDKRRNKTNWKFGSFLKGDRLALANRTREDSLFLSVGAQWNNEQLTRVYGWFEDRLRVVTSKEQLKPITAKILLDVEQDEEVREHMYNLITEKLQNADLGIYGVNVKQLEFQPEKVRFPKDIPNDIRQKVFKQMKKEPPIKVELVHINNISGKEVHFPLHEESDGTQRLFQLLGPWLQTVTFGITVFIDELETSLHTLLTRELIKFIQDPNINEGGGQLIFATHDTTLLDPELFRRDQIWFTEKNKSGATNLYSMSDYKERKPRKGEAMQKGYLSGRYGAIPMLEAFNLR